MALQLHSRRKGNMLAAAEATARRARNAAPAMKFAVDFFAILCLFGAMRMRSKTLLSTLRLTRPAL